MQMLRAALITLTIVGCTSESPDTGDDNNPGGSANGYVFSEFGFLYRDAAWDATEVDGFDLDGNTSTSDAPGEAECGHDDFTTPEGDAGIDYQMLRMIDDFSGLGQGQIIDGVINGAVRNGSMTMLLRIEGVDDLRNDDDVTVQLLSSQDVPLTGADGSILPLSTFSAHPDARFHSNTRSAALVDGVLSAGPFDLRWDFNIQIVQDELSLGDAWVRVAIADNGDISGVVAGYWDVQEVVDIIVDPTTNNDDAAGFSKEEGDTALATYADGSPAGDGGCTTISTVFQFAGVPAYVIDAP